MRGKRCCCCCVHCFSRITPAGAGKTFTYRAYVPIAQDHPRRCGENATAWRRLTVLPGSPPQVRGKLNRFKPKFNRFRITPAGAGKTRSARLCRRQLWDHPRRCGENYSRTANSAARVGLPPQVRGKPTLDDTAHIAVRITPAGAGKTAAGLSDCRAGWDHPRRCGENFEMLNNVFLKQGSPPRMRGKRDRRCHLPKKNRITPADAGKTLSLSERLRRRQDHPRGCGENADSTIAVSSS